MTCAGVYLDIGKFGGLAETMDESIPATQSAPRADGDAIGPCVLAGPTSPFGGRAGREAAVPAAGEPRRSATRC